MNNIEKVLPADLLTVSVKSLAKGFLVAFCGIDGSGKTTLINAIQQEFIDSNILSVIFTNHAGSASPYWQSTMLSKRQLEQSGILMPIDVDRTLQVCEFLAYARHVLPSLLSQHEVVLSDGYDISKSVYARVKLDGEIGTAERMLIAASDIIQPDLLIYLEVSAETAMRRVISRSSSREWNENLDVMNRAILYFHTFLKQRSYSVIINADQDQERVKDEAIKVILSKLAQQSI